MSVVLRLCLWFWLYSEYLQGYTEAAVFLEVTLSVLLKHVL